MFKIISWNVKSLKSPNKRMQILRHMKRLCSGIVFMQETHPKSEDSDRLKKLWVGSIFGSPAIDGKAGVITLIHKNFPYRLLSHTHDTAGRISHLTLMHEGDKLIISTCDNHRSRGSGEYSGSPCWVLEYYQIKDAETK